MMEKISKRITMLLLVMMMITQAFAQSSATEQIKRRAAEKVGLMNDYISYMANKKKSEKTRLYYKTKALRLFAGGGDSYEENGVQKEGVQKATTKKIAAEAGVNEVTIFRKFENKKNLIEAKWLAAYSII